MILTGFTTNYYFEFARKSNGFQNPSKKVQNNATILIRRVNNLLADIVKITGIAIDCIATSTIRTPEHNAKVGGSKNSLHLIAKALDIADKSGKLAKAIYDNQHLLKQHKLSFENPKYTKGWVHLDIAMRGGEYRMFSI